MIIIKADPLPQRLIVAVKRHLQWANWQAEAR